MQLARVDLIDEEEEIALAVPIFLYKPMWFAKLRVVQLRLARLRPRRASQGRVSRAAICLNDPSFPRSKGPEAKMPEYPAC
jgi:hypothetical protein